MQTLWKVRQFSQGGVPEHYSRKAVSMIYDGLCRFKQGLYSYKFGLRTLRLDFLHARQAVETLLFHEALELDAEDEGFASSRCGPS